MDATAIAKIIFDPASPVLISADFLFFVFKTLFLVAFAIYVIYALVIVRQISLMIKTVSAPLEYILSIFGYIHLALAVWIWILALLAR